MPIKPLMMLVAAGLISAGAYAYWMQRDANHVPEGFAMGNGRVEAERVDIGSKFAGRIEEITAREGSMVEAGAVVARLETTEIRAQLRESEALVSQVREALQEATAVAAQRASELKFAKAELDRALALAEKGHVSLERVEERRRNMETAEAALAVARARISHTTASIDAAVARVDRLRINLADHELKAPRRGRVQYRLVEPGEVVAAGGKVVTLLDLTDVHMTVFLPTREAGRLAIGDEARLIFDAAPEYVVPANVSFVAAEAQFTPKHVETANEREKLMFRVKLRLPREILEKYATLVKTGIPGIGYVRLTSKAEWPASLAIKLPE